MITSLCNLERFRRNRTGLIGRLCLVTLLIGVGWSQATGQVVQGQPGVWNGNPGNAQPGGYNAQGGAYSNGVRPGVNNGVQSNGPSRSGTDPRIASLPGPNTNVSYSNGAASTTGNPALGSTAAGSGGAGNGGKIPTKNLLQVFHDGGWMMYPIALCSFGLMVFAFERWIALRRTRVAPRHFVNRVIEQLQQQMIDRDEAVELCEKNDSPMARVMSAALKRYGRPAVEVEQAVLDAGERECNLLRRNMRAILAISNLSPLLGLLGTVLGMSVG